LPTIQRKTLMRSPGSFFSKKSCNSQFQTGKITSGKSDLKKVCLCETGRDCVIFLWLVSS
jgi:hypothetical protein